MRKKNKNVGYSVDLAEEYVDVCEDFICISEAYEVNVYDNDSKKYLDEFSHHVCYFTQKGLREPFKVKFEKKDFKIKFLDKVKINNLEACEIKNQVYFKADSIEVIK